MKLTIATLSTVCLLAACTQAPAPVDESTPTPAATSSVATLAPTPAAGEEIIIDIQQDEFDPEDVVSYDLEHTPGSDAAAIALVIEYFEILPDTSIPRAQWLEQLEPLVTNEHFREWLGGDELFGPDPTWFDSYGPRIGEARVEHHESESLTTVVISTTKYDEITFLLTRITDDGDWRIVGYQ